MPDVPVPMAAGVRLAHQVEADRWDRFVASVAGGRHVQLSAWGDLKAGDGWESKPVGLTRGDELVAGALLLYRTVPVLGRIGYVPHGPLFRETVGGGATDQMVWSIIQEATDLGLRHITVQPPATGRPTEESLQTFGFTPGESVAPSATLVIDLTSEDEVLSGMAARTRYNARLGEKRGLRFVEAGADDLAVFHSMLLGTAGRQGFEAPPLAYFRRMWDVFGPGGGIRLFLVERDGEPVSAMLAVIFAGTITNKLAVWSGEHGRDRPNEFLHWQVMRWAIQNGQKVYDFEGIPRPAAEAVQAGEPLPEKYAGSVASFKLGFGGRVVLGPEAMSWSPNALVASAYRVATSSRRGRRLAKRVLNQLRTGGLAQ